MVLRVNGSTHLIPAYYSLYRPRKYERLSWPSWLTYSGWLTHISGHPSAAGRAQDRESSPATDQRSTTVPRHQLLHNEKSKKVKVAHTRLPSVGFWSWSRFLAVSLQVTWVINPALGCHYFPSGPQLPSQPLRGLLPISLLGEQRHNGCEQFAQDCYPTASWLRSEPRPFCVESSMLTTRLPSHPVVGNSKEKSNYPTRDNSGIHLPWHHISDSCKSQSSLCQCFKQLHVDWIQ